MRWIAFIAFAGIVLAVAAACGNEEGGGAKPTATATVEEATDTPPPEATNTAPPAPTDTPVPPAPTEPPVQQQPTQPPAQQQPTQPPPQAENCDRQSYPDVCIPPYPPDLDCGDVPYRRFTVRPPDPHGFDRDGDGVGCES